MSDFRFVDGTRLISVVEALIFSSPDPISWDHISGIIQQSDEELQLDRNFIETVVGQLNKRYEENDLAFRITEVGGGFTFATQPRYYPWLSIFQHENSYRKLSQSAIESLAVVAYRQPITKPEVDQIRGVDSGYILRQLLEKMLIRVSGRADSPGKPLLYKTTDHFLKHFGINSVEELPRPREIEEILTDDDMADHRKLLMERQMELDEEGAEEIIESFFEKTTAGDGNVRQQDGTAMPGNEGRGEGRGEAVGAGRLDSDAEVDKPSQHEGEGETGEEIENARQQDHPEHAEKPGDAANWENSDAGDGEAKKSGSTGQEDRGQK